MLAAAPATAQTGVGGELVLAADQFLIRPVGRRDQSYLWMFVTAAVMVVVLALVGVARGLGQSEIVASLVRGVGATVVSVIAASPRHLWTRAEAVVSAVLATRRAFSAAVRAGDRQREAR